MTSPARIRAERERLPNRRALMTEPISGGGLSGLLSIGRYEDGHAAEAFLEVGKPGTDADLLCRDAACMWSLARQYGVPADVIARALARLEDGKPATIIGAMADAAAGASSIGEMVMNPGG